MLRRVCFSLAVSLIATPLLWCQVEPSATGGPGGGDDDSYMSMPAAVSGGFYPTETGSQGRSNYVSGGVIVSAGYDDNVLTGDSSSPVGAESYTIWPTIRVETKTGRTNADLNYNTGFTFYDPTSELNRVTQSAVGDFSYRWTPRTTVSFQDEFQQNSTVFSQPYTLSGSGVTGSSAGPAASIVIVPYIGQINNATQAEIGYQFSRDSMLGLSGTYSLFNFSNLTNEVGLYDSNTAGGTAFYSRRIGRSQFIGGTYSYSQTETSPVPTTTQSQMGTLFYSVVFNNHFSLSLKGGPEYSTTTSPGAAPSHTWGPNGVAGIGWQKNRANLAMAYSRAISTGWGLLGVYTADTASALFQWQFTQRLVGTLSGNYANIKDETPQLLSSIATGHTIFGRGSISYTVSEHLTAAVDYNQLHENYNGVGAITNHPDDSRVAVSLNYMFRRPLGK
jgi:hypothetical protein